MATNVVTKTVCDRCGKTHERPGAEGDTPPVNWFDFDLTRRLPGEGWTNNKATRATLCVNCGKAILTTLENCPGDGTDG